MSKAVVFLFLCLILQVRGAPRAGVIQEAEAAAGTSAPSPSAKSILRPPGLPPSSESHRFPIRRDSKSILSAIQTFLHGLYQEFLNRQHAIANLLACGNCVNEGWEAIMSAVANVPGLEWAYRPQTLESRPPNFFTALNQNGVVTGFGGSIIDNRPVVEFVFDHTGIVQQLNATNPDILHQ